MKTDLCELLQSRMAELAMLRIDKHTRGALEQRYDQALLIKEMYLLAETREERSFVVDMVSEAVGAHVNYIYAVMMLVDAFPPDQFEALCKLRTKAARQLSWSHFVVFAGVKPADRPKFIKDTCENCWNSDRADREATELYDRGFTFVNLLKSAKRRLASLAQTQNMMSKTIEKCRDHEHYDFLAALHVNQQHLTRQQMELVEQALKQLNG